MLIEPSTTPTRIAGSQVKVVFARGALNHLGDYVRQEGGSRVFLVTDPGIVAAGHVERAVRTLYRAGLVVGVFDKVEENPTTHHVDQALLVARRFEPDLIVGLGGGSAMDTAKGLNFLHTNGGRMPDYWGSGKAQKPMLPMIAIPTTAGTGSEAQSYALITNPQTHQKMACGDPKARPRLAVLDADLVATVPAAVAAATGIDAVAHAVVSSACNRRTDISRGLSKGAWHLLDSAFDAAIGSADADAQQRMLLGAHLAGAAIENAMLGAAHACANGLTARLGITHGIAVGVMLPAVVRFNTQLGDNPYSDLSPDGESLAQRITAMLRLAGLPTNLRDLQVPASARDELADIAARQWTATFNPRPVTAADLRRVYELAELHPKN